MAKEVKIIIDVDSKQAESDFSDLEDSLDSLGSKAKDAKEDVEDLGESAEDSGGKAKKGGKGFGILSSAMKFTGIGAAVGAFTSMGDVLMGNQGFADKFNIALESTKIVVSDIFNKLGDFINRMGKVGAKIMDVKGNFQKLKDGISNFGNMLKEKITDRVKQIINGFGLLGKAMKQLFEGDFKGALDTAKEGVNDIFAVDEKIAAVQRTIEKGKEIYNNVTEAISNTTQSTTNYTKSVIKSAKAIVNSRNELVKLVGEINLQKAAIQGVLNEEIRLRDNENLTFEQRQKHAMEVMNQQLLLLDQEKKMAEAVKENAEAELRTNADNLQAQQKLANANATLITLKQKETEIILGQTKMHHDLNKMRIAGIKEISMLNEMGRNRELEALREQGRLLLEQARKNGEGEAEVLEFIERKKEEIRVKYRDMNLQATSKLFGALAGTAEKGSKNWKMMAKAQALVNMYLGITSALKDPEMPFFARIANAAAVAIAGRNNIRSIVETKMSGEEGGEGEEGDVPAATGVGGIFSGNAGAMIPNQLTEDLVDAGQQPVQAYVVETDISNSQALQEELNLQTTL